MPEVRNTQRAPLSCASCAARKIKCSKDIPCRPCIARGAAAECRREVVRVRGKLRTADSPRGDLSYPQLLQENAQLSALICDRSHRDEPATRIVDVNDRYVAELWDATGRASEQRKIREREAISFPSRACSDAIVNRASVWTSWIHYAFFFPHFELEHHRYWLDEQSPGTLWLASYFSVLASTLLFMDDLEFEKIQPPSSDRVKLLKNWYEAALYYLDEADFMQNSDIRVVQAITILGIVATNIGDTVRHSHLWAVAIRMAQALGLGIDDEHKNETLLQREVRRRLWWTLIIGEWLLIPARNPCISASDFDCELPQELDDQSLINTSSQTSKSPKPVQYRITMSMVSIVVNRFRATLRAKAWSATQVAG